MEFRKEIKDLEIKMFDHMCKTNDAMFLMNKEGVRTGLATIKMLNEKYKELVKIDYVKSEYFDKQYKKLQNGCL